jgi:hypothetical protein
MLDLVWDIIAISKKTKSVVEYYVTAIHQLQSRLPPSKQLATEQVRCKYPLLARLISERRGSI